MYIYIDESGLFSTSDNENSWSSVGTIVIPDESLEKVENALNRLKQVNKLNNSEELKRNRPDSSSESFIYFIKSLKKYKCTLHVISTNGTFNDEESIINHKKSLIKAIQEFIKQKKYSDSNFSKLINIICELSLQQYNQFIHQSIIIYNLLDKIITFYSQVSPKSLVKFIWEIDQKDIKETKYEKVFKDVFIGIIEVLTKDKPLQIVNFKKSDYSYFFENFQIMDNTKMKELNKETKEIYKRDFGENEQYLRGIDLHKLLLNNLMLKDSKDSFGIQIADLLVSSVNRCLKRNFSDNEKMAKILGRLMINSYVENQKAILISTISEQNICVNRIDDITNIMDRESIKVYKFTTEIYSKKI